jgi:hypothetical protein
MMPIVEDFMWGISPVVQWLSRNSGYLAGILRPIDLTTYNEKAPQIFHLDTKDINTLTNQMQRIIGRLHAENTVLKNERELLVKKLYEDNVLNIGRELTEQLDSLARAIMTKGEITNFKQFPMAISSGRSHIVLGRLLAISKYHGRYYPILWKEEKLKVITQGVSQYEHVLRDMQSAKEEGAYPYAILSYDESGKFVPKTYMMV